MIDFSKIKLRPLKERKSKFSIGEIVRLDEKINVLNDENLKKLSAEILKARKNDEQVIFMMGAHLIKQGLSLFIIEMIRNGTIRHLAMNGAALIHDFEIAFIGETSEDVAENLPDGSFGMWTETLKMINEAVKKSSLGYGKAIGKLIHEKGMKFKEYSILYWCHKKKIPVTVHTAIGTEIIYQYPYCDGAALGRASYLDFKIFTDSVSRLQDGVIVNIGSAVIMPEVFLKSLSIVRNLGFKVDRFVSANLDMIDHYRTRVNVVERPTSKGGIGLNIVARHEETLPSLCKLLEETK
ncbi:hypothetical protein JXA85_04705 [Candidatus Woesearchaeota archaeon]|nr:hypothetical protein [Candidatus Woesearchaeota archaeon]